LYAFLRYEFTLSATRPTNTVRRLII